MMARHRRTANGRARVAVTIALSIMIVWSAAGAAQDEATRTLTLLAARCPATYVGDASADECDNAPMPGVAFRVGRPFTDFFMSAYTDASGLVVFDITNLPLHGIVRLMEELPPRTARIVAYCVDQAGAPLPLTYVAMPGNEPPIMVADVSVGETGDVYCDWYNVAFD
jgi:hypothetical protein